MMRSADERISNDDGKTMTNRVNKEQLLYDINELSHLFRESASIETLLNRAVGMVAERTHSAVCSIYLYNPEKQELTLRATKGLNPESVGRVHLRLGQGLTGLALQEMRPICESDASRNPNYEFFPGIFEERYNAFLAVPIARGVSKMGVLVLQREASQCYDESSITALETVASNSPTSSRTPSSWHPRTALERVKCTDSLKFVRGKVAAEDSPRAPGPQQAQELIFGHARVEKVYTLEDFRSVRCRASTGETPGQVEHRPDAAS
jgi:phosphotransferase system enzyme I (PtsP)